jgi:hypothetical protein
VLDALVLVALAVTVWALVNNRPRLAQTLLGLETGAADQDADGLVSVGELYTYVYDQVRDATPHQTPRMFANLEGTLYVARNLQAPQLSAAAFVDWEDLRWLLAAGGYTASPSWVLRALFRRLAPMPLC